MNRQRFSAALGALLCVFAFGCGDDDTSLPPDGAAGDDAGAAGCVSDLECDDGLVCNGVEVCAREVCAPGVAPDCDDGMACSLDRCVEARGGCVSDAPDADGDGHGDGGCGGDDCDDTDPERFPGNLEVCDEAGHDEDCDESTYGFRDADGDGFADARCCNGASCGPDCDDTLPSAHPGEAEACDGFDNDCDGAVDEGVTRTFVIDEDGDGFGAEDGESIDACFTPEGYAESASDCDDTRGHVRPGGVEICDAEVPPLDEDCDDEANPDALCNCEVGESRTCAEGGLGGACGGGTQNCIDGGWGACSIAPAAETCDGIDSDCDGTVDEMLTVRCF